MVRRSTPQRSRGEAVRLWRSMRELKLLNSGSFFGKA
jgi:hypothetical protein